MRWHARPVETDHGTRWVVESDTGEQQHHGHRYTEERRARQWVQILNAFHQAWEQDRENR